MDTKEGCATICDKNGNLLFYTNGITVYNRNHQVMLNGTGLASHISALQSSIIVPWPGNPTLYYIFTTDAFENSFANGYNYSIVDMSRDNGNGEVVTKNVLLTLSCSERMTAARAADGTSVWLITNDANANEYRSWLIDCGGLHAASPVLSVVGADLGIELIAGVGMLKVSPDGKQLCQTHTPDDGGLLNFFQLYDFDNATGSISNARTINIPGTEAIGCEYSPNSKLLYLLRSNQRKLDQVEPTLPTVAGIIASKVTINTTENYYGIQLAPDLKIYLATISGFLAAIRNPDTKGSGCNFVSNQIELVPGGSYAGLPAFINDLSYDGSNGFTYTILDSCTGKVQFNGFTSIPGSVTWDWDFGDLTTGTGQNPVHSFPAGNDVYKVRLKITSASGCASIERSKDIMPKGLAMTLSFDFIAKCDSGYVRFTNTSKFAPDSALVSYSWDFGDATVSASTNPIHSFPSGGGLYNVKLIAKTTTACLDKTLTVPINLEMLDIHATGGREIEIGEMAQLNVTGGGSNFTWTPSTGLSNASIPNPIASPVITTMYKVTVTNDAGCKDSDSVLVKVNLPPGIYVPSGFTPNNDGKNDLFRPLISGEYTLLNFSIYNRWGEKIFSTSQLGAGWNGKINGITQDSGVYVWIVSAVDNRDGKRQDRKGTFVVLR